MANLNASKGYTSSARVANAPGAYSEILSTDFGVQGGAAPGLVASAVGGSLATTTGRVAITWITTEGESQASTEATVAVTGATGSITVTKTATPTNGTTVLGWRIYSSSGGAGTPLYNAAGLSTAQTNFTTAHGVFAGFPVATTTAVIQVYGAGQVEPASDQSGIQFPLPLIGANTTLDYFFRLGNAASKWRVQKSVEWMRPAGAAEAAGIVIGPMDVIAPIYPGTSQVVPAVGTGSVAASASLPFMILNSILFAALVGGTTAATFIGFSAFNTNMFGLTTDGTVTWQCLGRVALVRCHVGNTSATPATPSAQEYDLFAA